MRVLVATTAGAGHFGPLLPFARACRDAGHDVVVAAPASFASAVERAGFAHRGFSDAPEEELRAVFETLPGLSNDEGNAVVIREVFARIDTRAALPGVDALVTQWRPDLIIREAGELASYIVAEAGGIPHVQVAVGLAWFDDFALSLIEDPLVELGAERGLAGLRSAPRLTLVPQSFEDPAAPGAEGTRRFRDDSSGGDGEPLPDWWNGSSHPLLYVTFGTVAAALALFPDFYRAVLAALADLPIRVLITIGDARDPELIEPVGANVHIEKWWPQKHVMPHASAMVGHGGFGTTLLGLASGLPMVVVPLFADQPHNARRVEAIGAGVALEGGPAAVGGLEGAVRQVLDDPAYRTAATRMAEEIARLPSSSTSVPLLETLMR